MKKTFLIILCPIIFLIFLLMGFSFAQGLEVEYPEFLGFKITETPTLPQYVAYIYYAIIGIAGIVALGSLIWAGYTYLTSTGVPEKLREAKDRITGVFLGLIILFCSWLILITINPELKILKMSPTISLLKDLPTGIFLCKKGVEVEKAWRLINIEYPNADEGGKVQIRNQIEQILAAISENCLVGVGSNRKIKGEVNYVYIVPKLEAKEFEDYGLILYEKENFKGRIEAIFPYPGRAIGPLSRRVSGFGGTFSVHTFNLVDPRREPWEVCLYEHILFNRDIEGGKECYSYLPTYWTDDFANPFPKGKGPLSIKVQRPAIVILKDSETGGSAVFPHFSEANLKNYEKYPEILKRECTGWRECDFIPSIDTVSIIIGEIFWD